jgi:high-affinity nickel-transport protein
MSATSAQSGMPVWFILVLPLLFVAGMSAIDTTDGVLMLGAYGWAYVKPVRKLYYNMNISLSFNPGCVWIAHHWCDVGG